MTSSIMIGVETVVQTSAVESDGAREGTGADAGTRARPAGLAGDGTGAGTPPGAAAGAEPAPGSNGVPWLLVHQHHRVPAGTSIRALLRQAGMASVIARIESGDLGLASHGKRAWLDDQLAEGARIEVVAPITTDAKAARVARVAADRRRRARSRTDG
jgi:putative ubiquitin-RnfH superfamily antitoxin RatB of RatAB toxin-antitoxin module